MAVENTLRLTFDSTSGKKQTISFKYANTSATAQQVQTLGSTIISNGIIYEDPPLALDSAEFVITTTTPIATS